MTWCRILLGAAALAIIAVGIHDATTGAKGPLLRRERRRIILTTVHTTAMCLWPLLYLSLPQPELTRGPVVRLALLVTVIWPLVLMGTDVVVTRSYVPSQEAMDRRTDRTQQNGQWIIGAVFAAGLLLSVLNKSQTGHLPESARIMLLGMLAIIACLVPSPSSDPASDLSWTVHAAQRSILHMAIGLFILATVLAWASPAAPAGSGGKGPLDKLVGGR